MQARTPRTLFEARPSLRKLVVVADADLLAAADDPWVTPTTLLTGLLTHSHVKLLRYQDKGPPTDLAGTGSPPKGWAYLLPPDGGEGRPLAYAHHSDQWMCTGVSTAAADHARGDTSSDAYADRRPEAAADQRERDALAANAAAALEADLFITGRPYLFGARAVSDSAVALCGVPEALSTVGLYLRSQGEFILWRPPNGSGGLTANEWLYYQIGAVALLPELWRWSSIQVPADRLGALKVLGDLNTALLLRVVRALRTRDSFHRAAGLPQRRDAVRTTLVELDTILVMLMGAVDASARFINALLAVVEKQRAAGWQKSQWRDKLANHSRPLADLFADGTPASDALTILSQLRNTVHGAAIQATLRQSGSTRDAPITLPADSEGKILAKMDNLGGRADWGASPSTSGAMLVDPVQFVQRLFPAVLGLLNAIMAATPSDYVPGQPPSPDSGPDWYSERNRLSVRWQLGL